MARRYAAIFKHLGVSYQGVDLGESWPARDTVDSVLICTPTPEHTRSIYNAADFYRGVPILCEKPFSTDLDQALDLCRWAAKVDANIRMVNQYAYLPGKGEGEGLTSYDYWNHGKDGLAWDCISVVALAKGRVELREESPIWQCAINGVQHYASEMDFAYIDMVSDWLSGNVSDLPYIRDAHTKVAAYLEAKS